MSLIDLYPEYLRASPAFVTIQDAMDPQIRLLRATTREILEQANVETATWGLTLWERQLGITPDPTLSQDERRDGIKAKLAGAQTTTKARLVAVCALFGCAVTVVEHTSKYYFELRFSEKGAINRVDALKAFIEEIKPAHLGVKYTFLFNQHQELQPYTHRELARRTHKEVREEDLTNEEH